MNPGADAPCGSAALPGGSTPGARQEGRRLAPRTPLDAEDAASPAAGDDPPARRTGMKDESTLESAGPVFIIVSLAAVMVLTTWLMVRGQGDWGKTPERAVATTAVAEAPAP